MKTCIWCKKNQKIVPFEKDAHIIPQSLGGNLLCDEVCDYCNAFFGNHSSGKPQIEVIIKETFYLSRLILLDSENEVGRNKIISRPKSIYFKIDVNKRKIGLKKSFLLQKGFKAKMCHQFKRGIYKLFLENNQKLNQNSLDDRFDFMRDFALGNIGNFPVIHWRRNKGLVLLSKEEIKHPKLNQTLNHNKVLKDFNFHEFEILGHRFAIPLNKTYQLTLTEYLRYGKNKYSNFFYAPMILKDIRQIDLSLGYLTK